MFVAAHLGDDVDWLVESLGNLGVAAAEGVGAEGDGAEGAVGAGMVTVVVHRSPGSVVNALSARGGRTPAVAAAVWERRTRRILEAVEGCPAVVVRPNREALGEVLAFLGARRAGAVAADGSAAPAPTPPPDSGGRWHPSPNQEYLCANLDSLVGAHRALDPGESGPETPSTEALVEADRCFGEERSRLERCLATAVSAVEGLDSSVPPAAPAFGPSIGLDAGADTDNYRRWVRYHEPRTAGAEPAGPGAEAETGGVLAEAAPAPVISVVLPVRQPDPERLERCINSLLAQTYGAWELCIAGVAEDRGVSDQLARRCGGQDPRVRFVEVPDAGDLSSPVNAAAAVATGEAVAFVDHNDVLAPGALAGVAALLADPRVGVVYTDEDEIDRNGQRTQPVFKPDWSPDLLFSTMYIGRLLTIRRSLFAQVGGVRPGLGDAAWYDLVLRATELAAGVAHLPVIGYHRQGRSNEATLDDDAAARVLLDALERRGVDAVVEPGLTPGSLRARRLIGDEPLVSVIVPFRDGARLLGRCVDSLRAGAGYDNWELILVDNQSWEPETAALRRRFEKDRRCRIVEDRRPFSWAAINNTAVEGAGGDLVLFLNSDVEGRSPGWLAAMVEQAQRPEVGAVGARLLYPDGRIQHAGVVMGLGGSAAWHAFCLCPGDRPGYLGHALMIRNYSAVTGAAMMVRTDVFRELGGFDERFAVCFNDVDFCLRLRQAGYRVVYTPYAELVHHESASRGVTVDPDDVEEFTRRWSPVIRRDPYFNPNLDLRRPEFALPR